jgi:hypothetical protein
MNHDVPPAPDQPRWRKSSYSQGENDCVEVAAAPDGGRWLRDTKDRGQATHHFTAPEWTAFLKRVIGGEFH